VAPEPGKDRWHRLEELFADAVELPDGERDLFVQRATAGDPEMRDDLAGLLAHATGAEQRIGSLIQEIAQAAAPAPLLAGRRFGPYKHVREVGRGGMGVVFEAIRDDDEYRKTVALKIAPWWHDAAALSESFRQERQIIAELEHPNIARFLDGGTEQGVPYFAMEFVEGIPVTTYCRQKGLTTRQRIELFLKVCSAVRYAHESLVVHRDLKPANILVDEGGVPKLLDFGIAKLLSPFSGANVTATQGMLWTPDFASPEQVRGRPATVRSDVYSLGLVLYEMLTDESGQKADTTSPLALDRSICDIEPPLPSRRVAANGKHALAKQLRGDLDTIVATAIRKEPNARYASVSEFSDDLQRYLESRPLRARAGTVLYRTRKLLRRHRMGAIAAGLLLVSIIAGIIATVHQARRAERRFAQVRKLANTFVFDVHDRVEKLPGSTEARKSIVETALVYLESLREDAAGDVELARELAQAYERIGDVQGLPTRSHLGDPQGALRSSARGEEMLRNTAYTSNAASLQQLAAFRWKTALVRQSQGSVKEASAEFQEARHIVDRLLTVSPHDRNTLDVAGEVYSQVSRMKYSQGAYKEAEEAAQKLMEIAKRIVDGDPRNREARANLSTAYTTLGTSQIAAGNLPDAAKSYRAGIQLREQVSGEEPGNPVFRRMVMVANGHLGDVLGFRATGNLGDLEGAAAAYGKSVEIARWLHANDAADRKAVFDLSSAELRLGSVLVDMGRASEGLTQLEHSAALNADLMGQDPKNTSYTYNAAFLHRKIAVALEQLNRTGDALRNVNHALEALREQIAARPKDIQLRSQLHLANALRALLLARGGNAEASAAADSTTEAFAADQPASKQPLLDAEVSRVLGRAYGELAKRSTGTKQVQLAARARSLVERSEQRWRDLPRTGFSDARSAREAASTRLLLDQIPARRE
jgi:serine/threonine protein kinase